MIHEKKFNVEIAQILPQLITFWRDQNWVEMEDWRKGKHGIPIKLLNLVGSKIIIIEWTD